MLKLPNLPPVKEVDHVIDLMLDVSPFLKPLTHSLLLNMKNGNNDK
jgi:hypothetical protein